MILDQVQVGKRDTKEKIKIAFVFTYFSIKQCLNYFIHAHFFHGNGLIIFLLLLMGKIRLVQVQGSGTV